MDKKIIENSDGILTREISRIERIISQTLGPNGKNVIIEKKDGYPMITNDGVTIAREIGFKNNMSNIAADLIKQTAMVTQENAGDGTTSTVIITNSILQNFNNIKTDIENIQELREGLNFAGRIAKKYIEDNVKIDTKLEDIKYVAKISSNDEDISDSIHDVFNKVGKDGVIDIEKSSYLMGISHEISSGIKIDKGSVNENFLDPTTDYYKSQFKWRCIINIIK